MKTQPDQKYFDWLVTQITLPNRRHSFTELFERLHETEFLWSVPHDDNRLADGKDLRTYYFPGGRKYQRFKNYVSVLEVLIGLSRRLAFMAGGESGLWAWQLIDNLGLENCFDPLSVRKQDLIDETMRVLIFRTYRPDGLGGFFPLNHPPRDLTHEELWYQMCQYVNEINQPT